MCGFFFLGGGYLTSPVHLDFNKVDSHISLRGEVLAHKTSVTSSLCFKCLYQTTKVSDLSIAFWNCSDSEVFLSFIINITLCSNTAEQNTINCTFSIFNVASLENKQRLQRCVSSKRNL